MSASESERQERIKSRLYLFPNVTGVSIMPDKIQVKLKHGTPIPANMGYIEGMRIEYVYEEPSPFAGGVPL